MTAIVATIALIACVALSGLAVGVIVTKLFERLDAKLERHYANKLDMTVDEFRDSIADFKTRATERSDRLQQARSRRERRR